MFTLAPYTCKTDKYWSIFLLQLSMKLFPKQKLKKIKILLYNKVIILLINSPPLFLRTFELVDTRVAGASLWSLKILFSVSTTIYFLIWYIFFPGGAKVTWNYPTCSEGCLWHYTGGKQLCFLNLTLNLFISLTGGVCLFRLLDENSYYVSHILRFTMRLASCTNTIIICFIELSSVRSLLYLYWGIQEVRVVPHLPSRSEHY